MGELEVDIRFFLIGFMNNSCKCVFFLAQQVSESC